MVNRTSIRNAIIFFQIFLLIFLGGTLGYILIERYSLIDALYMTTITISTVGFREVSPLSNPGKIFTIFLVFSGITMALYGLTSITVFFIEGELTKFLKGVKMKKDIAKLDHHYIICGAGKTGEKIIDEFFSLNEKFVVVEEDEQRAEHLRIKYNDQLLLVMDDATRDEVLLDAGVTSAQALIGVLPDDAENVFLTLTAKSLNTNIRVITRAIETSSEKKLKKAGADKIISQIDIAAQRLTTTALKPDIESFLDIITQVGDENFRIEFVSVSPKSDLENVLLRDAQIPQKTNLIVIGIKKNGTIQMNPMSMTRVERDDELLVLGKQSQIETIRKIARGKIGLSDIPDPA
ncbi:MAG: potassium channel family protein [Fibrobacterota bacterium]